MIRAISFRRRGPGRNSERKLILNEERSAAAFFSERALYISA